MFNPIIGMCQKSTDDVFKFCNAAIVIPKQEWSTENRVVYENKTMKLRHFGGDGPPVLVLPPQAGHHSNLCDYPGQSLVDTLRRRGLNVFCCEWLSVTYKYKNLGVADYVALTIKAIDKIIQLTGYPTVNLVGECQGGWQAAMVASICPQKISTLVVAAAPIDVDAQHGKILDYARIPGFLEFLVAVNNGVLPGKYILMGFKSLQPEEHYFNKYQRLWKMVQENDVKGIERFRTFENWYEYAQDLPGNFYLDAINMIFRDNLLIEPDAIVLNGIPVNLKKITCPIVLLTGEKDHISPPMQTLAMEKYISSKKVVKIWIPGAGHIGVLMGNNALANYWTFIGDWMISDGAMELKFDDGYMNAH